MRRIQIAMRVTSKEIECEFQAHKYLEFLSSKVYTVLVIAGLWMDEERAGINKPNFYECMWKFTPKVSWRQSLINSQGKHWVNKR